MPALDEDILRDLMDRATSDLHAPAALAGQIITRQRQRRQLRATGVTVTGVAAAAAVAVAVTAPGATGQSGHRGSTAVQLTAAQQTLVQLSSKAAAAAQAGRYVQLKELRGRDRQTTIVDTRTGNTWTLPGPHGKPLYSPHGLPTAAQLAAYPTRVPALRSALITQARQQRARALREIRAQLARLPAADRAKKRAAGSRAAQPRETADDWAFAQAAYLLWNPVVSPSLRSALLKVLAATPGVQVSAHARDDAGRAAVEISRHDSQAGYTEAIFEAPDATRVLETASIRAAAPATGRLPAQPGYRLTDVYLSVSRLAALPPAARGHS